MYFCDVMCVFELCVIVFLYSKLYNYVYYINFIDVSNLWY